MRKQLFTLATLTLASSLFSASAFAAESPMQQPTEMTQPVQIEAAPQESQVTQDPLAPLIVADNTARTVTDGIHVDINYPAQAFIPEFTTELWSVTDNKLISSAVGNSKNYDRASGVYHLIFNHPGYKLGDQFALILRKADGVVSYIRFNDERPDEKGQLHYYDLKVNTNYQFKIDSFTYFEGDEGNEKVIKDLAATDLHPIKATLQTDSRKVGLFLKTEDGAPLTKTLVQIKLLENMGTFSAVSDDNGMVWLDSNKLTWKFLISSEGKSVKDGVNGKGEIVLPQSVITGSQKQAVSIPIVFEKKVADSQVKVNFTPVGNVDLSAAWSGVDVTLTTPDGVSSTYSLNLENNIISGLPDGTYKVSVEGKYSEAILKSESLTVSKGNGGTLDITLNPKYTLEIDKEGEPFNFSVINVEKVADKKFSGKEPLVFGVTPGESFMIKDNDTGKVDTIFIDPKSERTKIVLGAGVVFGGSVTIPHTGDSILYLVTCFVLCIMLATVSFVFYRRRKQKCQL